jgi:colanic acid biosynthesis glycosyl transferase WcaI
VIKVISNCNMRILLLTQWYLPEPQKWRSDIAETLQALGHDVTVLTGFPNYPSGNLFPGYRIRTCQRETINGVRVIRVPLYPDHSRKALKRMLNYVSFTMAASLIGPWVIPRPDVVYVLSPPLTLALPGWLLSRAYRTPMAGEIQDMWPETLAATDMSNSRWIFSVLGWMGKWFYRRCDAIRVISPGFRENLLGKGVPSEKIHVIPNWVDTDFYSPRNRNPELEKRLGLDGHFNVVFAGVLGLAQGLDTILDAANLLREEKSIQFVLVGDGVELERLQSQVTAEGLANVRFLGRFSADEMSDIYALADVLLVHLRDAPLFRITIPHKIYAYMAVGKPVLAAVEGDAATTIQAAGAGLTCLSDNPKALAETVLQFYKMSAEERYLMGQNGRRTACKEYHREHLIRQISEMFEKITSK